MTKSATKIKYNVARDAAFQEELFRAKKKFFASRKSGCKANGKMWAKTVFLFSVYVLLWSTLALQHHSILTTILLMVTMAAFSQIIGFTVAHDAVHGSYSQKNWINEALYYVSFNMFGTNSYLWQYRHRNAHHFCVNIPGADFDIEGSTVVRLAPHKKWHFFHRYQHMYASLGYMLYSLHWIFVKDFIIYFQKDFGAVTGLKHPWWRFVELVVLKSLYVGYMVVIPCLVLDYPVWYIIAGFLCYHFVLSWSFTMSFVSSHLSQDTKYIVDEPDGRVPYSFAVHQLYTSIDFHPLNPLVSFIYGGFNCHVAHHIFPEVNSIHLPELTKVIQKVCKKYDLPYMEMPIPTLFAKHFALLKELGSSPEGGQDKMVHLQANEA